MLFIASAVMLMAPISMSGQSILKSLLSKSDSTSTSSSESSSSSSSILGSILSKASSASSSSSDDSSSSQSVIGSLLSDLIGNSTTVTVEKLAGTWNYSSPECRFTSENALAKAGGSVAASTVEEKLTSIYSAINIKSSNTSFTFNEDGTCVMVLGGRSINGTYTLDSDTRALSMKSNTGIIKLNAEVYYSYTTLSLLFDANKLMTIVKMISSFTGKGSSTMSTVSSILDNYDGMMIGMNLTK